VVVEVEVAAVVVVLVLVLVLADARVLLSTSVRRKKSLFMLEDMDSWRRGPAVRYFFFSFTSSSSTPSSWMPQSRKG